MFCKSGNDRNAPGPGDRCDSRHPRDPRPFRRSLHRSRGRLRPHGRQARLHSPSHGARFCQRHREPSQCAPRALPRREPDRGSRDLAPGSRRPAHFRHSVSGPARLLLAANVAIRGRSLAGYRRRDRRGPPGAGSGSQPHRAFRLSDGRSERSPFACRGFGHTGDRRPGAFRGRIGAAERKAGSAAAGRAGPARARPGGGSAHRRSIRMQPPLRHLSCAAGCWWEPRSRSHFLDIPASPAA